MSKLCTKALLAIILLLVSVNLFAQNETRQELINWRFRDLNETVWHKAHVPGNILDDLYKNDLIENPLFGKNFEKISTTVENKNWEYTCYFDIKNKKKEYELVFDGINTYAQIILNGNTILLTDNFNKEWKIDITKYLFPENNYLIVKFLKQAEFTTVYKQTFPNNKLAWHSTIPAYLDGTDFSERIIGCGIWKNVYIQEKGYKNNKSLNEEPISKFNDTEHCLENEVDDLDTRSVVWLPLNIYAGANSNFDYVRMINMCKQANINTIRVWCGGYYERDIFYELCSQNNIAVIQDIIFNKNVYTMNATEINEYIGETINQISKLRKHKCIVAWAGNLNNEYNIKPEILKYSLFKKLVADSLQKIIASIDSRPYFIWDEQASNSIASYAEKNIWWTNNNWLSIQPLNFSFQSMPSPYTVKQFTKNIKGDSENLQAHQKCEFGFENINAALDNYPAAKDSLAYVYFTQLAQRDKLIDAINLQRGAFPYSKGISIWHLNDVWPGVTSSLIDYYYRPKASFYALKTLFSDNYISLSKNIMNESGKNILDTNAYSYAFVINFPQISIGNFKTNLYVIDLYGDTVYQQLDITWKNGIRNQYYFNDIFYYKTENTFNWKTQYIKIEIVNNEGSPIHTQRFYLAKPKEYKLDKAHVFYNWINNNTLEIQANTFTKDIYLYSTSDKTKFSDNFFDMDKYETKIIKVENFNQDRDKLKIFSHYDMCAE